MKFGHGKLNGNHTIIINAKVSEYLFLFRAQIAGRIFKQSKI